MAKLIYALNQSLDGYIDHDAFAPPGIELFRHFIEHTRNSAAAIYGRVMYETMRYWDAEDPNWDADRRAYAQAWRVMPKWVVSRTLKAAGPNATLISDNVEAAIREVKKKLSGDIEIAGPALAHSLRDANLIDEYQIYLRPFVVGKGKTYFPGPRPKLRYVTSERIGEDALRLTYAPE